MSTTEKSWKFVTNHTQVLLSITRDRDVRMRDIAETVGITERAAQRIVSELIDAGYVSRERVGRRNHYVVNPELKMRHPSQRDHEVGGLLELLQLPRSESPRRQSKTDAPQRHPKPAARRPRSWVFPVRKPGKNEASAVLRGRPFLLQRWRGGTAVLLVFGTR